MPASIPAGRSLTIKGNSHTISNMKVRNYTLESDASGVAGNGSSCDYRAGFIGENLGTLTIQELSFSNADVDMDPLSCEASTGSSQIAVVCGFNSGTLTLDTVSVNEGIVKGYTKVAALVGYSSSGLATIRKCAIKNTTITLEADGSDPEAAFAGVIVGYDSDRKAKIHGIKIENSEAVIDESTVNWSKTIQKNGDIQYVTTNNGKYGLICQTSPIGGRNMEQVEFKVEANGYLFENLADVFSIFNDNDTSIKLIDDVAVTTEIKLNTNTKYTLDLNGHKITTTDASLYSAFTITNGSLEVINSDASDESGIFTKGRAFAVKYDAENQTHGELTIGKNVNVVADDNCCVFIVGKGSKLTTEGNLKTPSSDFAAVSGNGSIGDAYIGIEVYIKGGKIIAENTTAVYFPNKTTLEITGGTIQGATAIYQKSGSLTITGNPIIKATGAKAEYKYNGNGANETGDALVVDNCGYPSGVPTVSITGGYFSSANNKAIGSYTKDSTFARIEGFVSGGYFSDYDNSLLTSGKAYVSSDKDGYLYMVTDKKENLGNTETSVVIGSNGVTGNDIGLAGDALQIDSTALIQAGLDVLNTNDCATTSQAKSALDNANIPYNPASGDTLEIVARIFIELNVISYNSGEALTVDITPKYILKAKVDRENGTEDGTAIDFGDLSITQPVEVTIPLPEGFNNVGNYVYISHKGYIYEAQVSRDEDGRLVATFTNPHGFSEFTITNANNAVARICNESGEETLYTTLEKAVKEVKNDETINVLKETTEVITVNKVITFTVICNTNNETFPFEIKAGDSVTLTTEEIENNMIKYKFTKKEAAPTGGGTSSGTTTYTVKFETNGGSEIENQKVKSNNKVTKPEEPTREGYKFAGWFEDKELKSEYDFDSKVTKSFTLYAKWEEIEEEYKNPFVDVKPSQWFYNAIKFANQNKIFNGMSSTTFEPDTAMTRAMFVTVLYRLAGEPAVNGESKFADVIRGSYYEKAVIWAEKYEIVKGISDTEFAPDVEITREQMSAIMHRFAKYMQYDVSVGENTNILSYEDFDEISEYAIPSMQWAVGTGLMKGQTDSTLNPRATTTRAEVATLLQRFKENN